MNFPLGVQGLTGKITSLAEFSLIKQPVQAAVYSGQGMKEGERPHFKKMQTPAAEKPSPVCPRLSERNVPANTAWTLGPGTKRNRNSGREAGPEP